jgi:hypothetical protein
MILVRELAYIQPRMLLFAVFASFGFAGSELAYRMSDEVECDLPLAERTSSKLFAMRSGFWEMLPQDRIMYPKSTLRRTIGIAHAVSAVTFLLLIASLEWPFPAP